MAYLTRLISPAQNVVASKCAVIVKVSRFLYVVITCQSTDRSAMLKLCSATESQVLCRSHVWHHTLAVCRCPRQLCVMLIDCSGKINAAPGSAQIGGKDPKSQASVDQLESFPVAYHTTSRQDSLSNGPTTLGESLQFQPDTHVNRSWREPEDICGSATNLAPVVESFTAPQPPQQMPTSIRSGVLAELFHTDQNRTVQNVEEEEPSGPHGTLMLDKAGRSKYLGPTAGSEWLKDVSVIGLRGYSKLITLVGIPRCIRQSVCYSRSISREQPRPGSFPDRFVAFCPCCYNFPFQYFSCSHQHPGSAIPPASERRGVVPCRGVLSLLCLAVSAVSLETEAFLTKPSHDVAPKGSFKKTFDRVYMLASKTPYPVVVSPQEIALVFIIMAQGTLYNIEMPSHDASAEAWLRLSEQALVKGNFLSNNTVAGLQTLVCSIQGYYFWSVTDSS